MPSKKFYHDIDLQGSKLINVGPTNATIDSGLGSGGGSDPVLEARVEKLENQSATILTPFSDNLDNELLIDWDSSSNVTRTSAGGQTYVSISPLSVTSNANLQTEADTANTTQVNYTSGAVRNNQGAEGVFTSNYYTINASTQAQINASYTTTTADTFSDETVHATTGILDNVINFYTVSDTNTRWFFYQTLAGYGDTYGWAINTLNGNTVMSHRRIGTAGPAGNMANPAYRTLSAKLDNNGNVWVSAFRYVGGTATSNIRMCTYRIMKNSPSTDNYTDERTPLVSAVISAIDTFFDTATDRYHAFYIQSTGTNSQILIYNSNNGATATFNKNVNIIGNSAPGWGTVSNIVWNAKLVKSSDASKEVGIFIGYNTNTTNSIRGHRYTIDESLTYGNVTTSSVVQFSPTGASSGVFEVGFDATQGFVGVNTRFGGASIDFMKITSTFSASGNLSLFNNQAVSPSISNTKLSAGIVEGSHFYFAGVGNDGAYDRVYYTKMRLTDGSVSSVAGGVLHQRIAGTTAFINYDFDQPVFIKQGSTLSLFYEKSTGNPNNLFGSVNFGTYPSKLKIEAQMIGQSWVTVFDNNQSINNLNSIVTLSGAKQTQIRVRLTMTSPNASTQVSTVSQYSVTVPGNDSQGFLVTKSLINNTPIAKVTLSPDLTLTGSGIAGTITFQASNNGGLNWTNATNATDYIFTTIGSDLRLKATINIPIGGGFSPRINGYSGTAGDIARQSDLSIININLLKTSLQLNTLLTAQRLSWTNMMVDTFQNGDGVILGSGLTLTGGTITGTGTVTSVTEDADITAVNSVVVVAETAGTVTFEFSRDDGVNWQPLNTDTLQPLTLGTVKNKLKLRATLTSGTLYGWAYLYA